jgi:hypothetical protein
MGLDHWQIHLFSYLNKRPKIDKSIILQEEHQDREDRLDETEYMWPKHIYRIDKIVLEPKTKGEDLEAVIRIKILW